MTPNPSNQKKFYIPISPVINRTHPSNQKKFYMLLYPVSFAPVAFTSFKQPSAAFHQKVSTHKIYFDKYRPNQKETFYPPPVSALQSSKPPTKYAPNIGKLTNDFYTTNPYIKLRLTDSIHMKTKIIH